MGEAFKEYTKHGWSIVPIAPGRKSPTTHEWNHQKNAITDPVTAEKLRSAGLLHATSGTCAIDVDNYPVAAAWLAERGVDLDALFAAPDSVQISSGRSGHGKLVYALPEPLASKKVAKDENKKDALDFRCATATGRSVQDVLPPSIHPDTGMPYKWVYGDNMLVDWQTVPDIPEALHKIWIAELATATDRNEVPDKGAAPAELKELLEHQDPNMSRDEWVRIGMILHHETDGSAEGLALWDEWSQGSNAKYSGITDLEICWRSFHDTPNAVTVGVLRQAVLPTADEFPHVADIAPDADDPWDAIAQQKRDRFRLVPVAEVAQRDPPEWFVEGIIPRADLAMMYGAPGSGKSFVALDLAFAVATGFTWFNAEVHPGPVVWVAAEAAGAMRNRARAYAQARGVQLETTDLRIMEQQLSLMDSTDTDALAHVMADHPPALIIVDTLAAASGGADENSGADMNKVLANCRKLHEQTGALVLLIHHSGKDESKGARGWSGMKAASRTELRLTHKAGSPFHVMEVTKQSEGIEGEKYAFKLQVVPLDFDDTTSCVVDPIDSAVLDDDSNTRRLGGTQKLLFDVASQLAGEDLNESGELSVQIVYDTVIDQMPPPLTGDRDRRPETMRRALATLHEKGYITISEGIVTIGSALDA